MKPRKTGRARHIEHPVELELGALTGDIVAAAVAVRRRGAPDDELWELVDEYIRLSDIAVGTDVSTGSDNGCRLLIEKGPNGTLKMLSTVFSEPLADPAKCKHDWGKLFSGWRCVKCWQWSKVGPTAQTDPPNPMEEKKP